MCKGSPGQDGNWCLWQKDRIEVTVPGNIPPGEYLVRVEHIGLHEAEKGRAQFYSRLLFFLSLFFLFFVFDWFVIRGLDLDSTRGVVCSLYWLDR